MGKNRETTAAGETDPSRDRRQRDAVNRWLAAGCRGTCVWPTGTGKTRIALMAIRTFVKQRPGTHVIIVVPTIMLKEQWEGQLADWKVEKDCTVLVINTAAKTQCACDILVIDEIHVVPTTIFGQVFSSINYRYVLGLTATFERLDGKEEIISQYCPVIDELTTAEAEEQGWLAPYKEYQVLINVPDIDVYSELTHEFTEHFEFFGADFNKAMSMIGPTGYKSQLAYREYMGGEKKMPLSTIRNHAYGFIRAIQKRKKFINDHPLKVLTARHIIDNRPGKKIITFSNTIAMARTINRGVLYAGAGKAKDSTAVLEAFNASGEGTINSCRKLVTGTDIKGLSVAIMLGIDSSQLKAVQKRGRVIRFEEGKDAEIFNIIIDGTVEVDWFRRSHRGVPYTTIDAGGLDDVLAGREPQEHAEAKAHAYHY